MKYYIMFCMFIFLIGMIKLTGYHMYLKKLGVETDSTFKSEVREISYWLLYSFIPIQNIFLLLGVLVTKNEQMFMQEIMLGKKFKEIDK